MWIIILAQIFPILLFIYFYIKHKQSYWQRLGIPGPKPIFLLGHQPILIKTGHARTELEWSRKYGKVYGTYTGLSPTLTISDVEMIKQITVKDFPYFVNRRIQRFKGSVWSQNLSFVEDERWKNMRSITSPTFTTGKLRAMFRMMNVCVDQLNEHLLIRTQIDGGQIDVKKVIIGFTIDVIARTSFATKTNSNANNIVDRNNNTFLYHSINMFRISPFRGVSSLTMPLWFNQLLGITHPFSTENMDFFTNLSRTVIQQRKQMKNGDDSGGKKRQDLIQILMDSYVDEEDSAAAKSGENNYHHLTATMDDDNIQPNGRANNGSTTSAPPITGARKQLTEDEIIAQCIVFFTAGFETTATTLTYTMYELALNPEVQDRLVQELQQALEGVAEDTDEYYDIVMNRIPYLNAIPKETLRKYPPVPRLERRVTKDGYKLGGVQLHKDQLVEMCVYAVHHSPEYYPEPERYDPDRFMPANKRNLVPYSYLPFGAGPRNCIGMRFAYQEVKLCLAKVMPKFRILPTVDTPVPLEFSKTNFMLSVDKMPLRVEQRL